MFGSSVCYSSVCLLLWLLLLLLFTKQPHSLALLSLCEATFDWGGVNQEFWSDMIRKRKLDVDVDSIRFEKDHIFRKRYHVFMRKNG
jgi:hypothetical protein